MTIQEEISTLREALLQHAPDKVVGSWTDSFLYSIWKKQRAEAIRSRFFTTNKQTFCLELEDALSHECGCVPVGCKVRKSIHPIPQAADGYINIRTLDNRVIGAMPVNNQFSSSLDPLLNNKRRYSIVNQHVIIWNDPYLKAVQVEAVWEDPYDWVGIQYCGSDNGLDDCAELDTIDAGITEQQSNMALRLSLNILLPLLNIPVNGKEDVYPKG